MFGTSGIRGTVGEKITGELALSVGHALATSGYDQVVIGRDPRESGEFLTQALSAGLRECGTDVIDIGIAATPTIARSVGVRDADAGIAVTASHNPAPDNGIKLWNPDGQAFDDEQRTTITERIRQDETTLESWNTLGTYSRWDQAAQKHKEQLVESGAPLDGITAIVDLGNGAGGVTVEALLELGATVETLNAQPDGRFPGRNSEPTAENCSSLCSLVAETDADVGIAHDGDADRMMAVDERGQFLAGDVLLTLFARTEAAQGECVAAPLNTSLAVEDALAAKGVSLRRTRVGDVHVAAAATASDVAFGGEPSGAWIWPAETRCPDGPLAVVKLLELIVDQGPLSEQVATIPQYPLRRESVRVSAKEAVMDAITDAVQHRYDTVDTMDGVRVEVTDGWFLIRASGTQPLIRLTAEAREADRCDQLLAEAREIVAEQTTDNSLE